MVLILCLSINTLIAISSLLYSTGLIKKIKDKWILKDSKIITITMSENINLFYRISQIIHKHAHKIPNKKPYTFNEEKNQRIHFLPNINDEIELSTNDGPVYIKSISLDSLTLSAFEIRSELNSPALENFLMYAMNQLKPKISPEEHKELASILRISPEFESSDKSKFIIDIDTKENYQS